MSHLAKATGLITEATRTGQEARARFTQSLGEPVVFCRFEGLDERFGIGWFRAKDGFVAYQRYANGFHSTPIATMPDELVRRLAAKLAEEDDDL